MHNNKLFQTKKPFSRCFVQYYLFSQIFYFGKSHVTCVLLYRQY